MTLTQKPTPNYTQGRTAKVDRVVLHWIVGTLASADITFANPNSKVSAHYAIENSVIHQYVREADTAWHAGDGSMNSRSIGIEHSAAPNRPASASTIETSAQLLAGIAKRHNLTLNRTTVIKHSQVVPTVCCGTIPIDTIISRANEILEGEQMTQVLTNKNHVIVLFEQFKDVAPTAAQLKYYVGKPYDVILNDLHPTRIDLGDTLAENKQLKVELAIESMPLKPGKYLVK